MIDKIINIKKRFNSGNTRSLTVKKNFIGSLIIKGVSVSITFFLVPITLGYVSDELYGIWLILSSVLMMIQWFDIGFTLGLKNKLTESLAVGNIFRGKYLVSTTYAMMIIMFIPLCIILEIITPVIPWSKLFNVPEIYNIEIIQALRIMFVCICTQMILSTLVSVLSAYQRTAIATLFPVLGNIISLIIIILLRNYSEPSLSKLAFAISTMPSLVLLIASLYLYNRKYRAVSPSIKYIDFRLVKEIFTLGSKFFIIQIQIIVLFQATNILISNVSNPVEVACYNIAHRYLNISIVIFNILMNPIWPAFTDAYAKKDFRWMKNVYRKLQKLFCLNIIVIMFLVVLSPFIYKIWIGNKLTIPISMTISVALYVVVFSLNTLQTMLINGFGHVKLQTYVCLSGLLVYLPLAIGLGKHIGAIGVVLAMVIIYTLYAPIFRIQLRKLLNDTATGIWRE